MVRHTRFPTLSEGWSIMVAAVAATVYIAMLYVKAAEQMDESCMHVRPHSTLCWATVKWGKHWQPKE